MIRAKMNDYDVDDIAFLTGDSQLGINKKALYEPSGMVDRVRRVILSPKKACCIAVGCFFGILCIAIIAAFARPYIYCPCSHDEAAKHGASNITTTPAPTPPTATDGEPFPYNEIRLQAYVKPLYYSIYMHPNLTTFDHSGIVNITFQLMQPQHFIVLHVKQLKLNGVLLADGGEIQVKKILEHEKHEQLYVEFSHKLKENKTYKLSIEFSGNLTEKLEGFYLSSYTTTRGEKRYLATTHFEPTYARTAFPCFDEPAMKAKFNMSIVRDGSHIALFNTPIERSEVLSNGFHVDHFSETVKMSTYLIAFVVCDYKNLTSKAKELQGVKLSVFAPPDQINQAAFALSIAERVLPFYNKFFGINYPLAKQDLIAIPDFGAGAMENWGLTTYRETAILADLNETSVSKQQQIATTISHELAHQWFGNLVSMEWWNDLWLNEGFASFVENLGTDEVQPGWKMMEQFVVDKTHPALQMDALASSHPISVRVDDPTEIESIFDAISYNKGAAIMHMLENFLGKMTLQAGLKKYLQKFQYGNAKTEDLWDVLSTESKSLNASVDVKSIMDTWTQQMGFPLINVTKQGNKIIAKQHRFLVGLGPEDDVSSEYISKYGYKWQVPLTYITDKSKSHSNLVWMALDDTEFDVDPDIHWIKCNVNQTGFYRVTYDVEMWNNIVTALMKDHTVFSAADRASLLDDAFTLARNNMLDPTVALNMTKYLVNERDFIPWITALEHIANLNVVLRERPSYIYLKGFIRNLLQPIVDHVGWDDSGSHLLSLLRPNVLHAAVHYENQDVIREAKKRFDDWRNKNVSVPPSMRGVVYPVGIQYGTYEDWQYCWNHYNLTQVPSEKILLLTALGSSKDPWVLSQYLEFSLMREKIRPQNTYIVLRSVYLNEIGRDLTWRFVRSKWSTLVELFGLGSFAMSNIIADVTNHFVTDFDHREVQAFFADREVGSGKRAVKSSLEKIRSNIEWLKQNEDSVAQWLESESRQMN